VFSKRLGRLLKWARAEPPEPDPHAFLERVVDALRLAALPAEDQVAALPDFVHVPDEVALLYEDAWVLVPQIREAGLLTDDEHAALARLDRHYGEMSDAPDKDSLWTLEAMKHDDRWTKSRQLAVDALAALGRTPGRPEFPGITWIPAGD
jgi:hypothetical protein